jgi:hypothetical protein
VTFRRNLHTSFASIPPGAYGDQSAGCVNSASVNLRH